MDQTSHQIQIDGFWRMNKDKYVKLTLYEEDEKANTIIFIPLI